MTPSQPRIAVLLSTYNGESFVTAQIESVLAQDMDNVTLYVRDDGSSDGTLDILRDYEHKGQLVLFAESNRGVVPSFIELITRTADDFDYVALCDQDDIWYPNKLSRAISVLATRDQSIPQLYCAEYRYCDKDMVPGERSHLNRIGVYFDTMLYENMVSGNTCVLNQRLAQTVAAAGVDGVYCHDWWIALVATSLGELSFDDFLCLDYRRTGSNASPAGTSGVSLLRYRIRTFFVDRQLDKVTNQLQRLYDLYADSLSKEHRALLERFLRGNRFKKALTPVRLRQMLRDEVALRLLFLIHLL